MLQKIEQTANDALVGRSLPSLLPRASPRGEERRSRPLSEARMAATATRQREHARQRPPARGARRLRVHRSCRWASSSLFFIYPLVYAVYISRYDWGVFGKIETLGLDNYRELVPRRDLPARAQEHALLHGRSSFRSRWRSGSRWRWSSTPASAARRSSAPRSTSLARLLGGDHRDRDLHPLRRRAAERDHRRQPAVVRRLRHGALVDRRPERLDDLRDDDALLPRRAAGDPDRRLRGGGDRRRQDAGGRSGRSPSRCSSRATSSSRSSR